MVSVNISSDRVRSGYEITTKLASWENLFILVFKERMKKKMTTCSLLFREMCSGPIVEIIDRSDG